MWRFKSGRAVANLFSGFTVRKLGNTPDLASGSTDPDLLAATAVFWPTTGQLERDRLGLCLTAPASPNKNERMVHVRSAAVPQQHNTDKRVIRWVVMAKARLTPAACAEHARQRLQRAWHPERSVQVPERDRHLKVCRSTARVNGPWQ